MSAPLAKTPAKENAAAVGRGDTLGDASGYSREQFDEFGERLMPVLKDVGIELSAEPETLEIHNIIRR